MIELTNEGIDLKKTIADIEKSLIAQALDRSGFNKSEAARLLNIKRTTLIMKINKIEEDNEAVS